MEGAIELLAARATKGGKSRSKAARGRKKKADAGATQA